MSVHSPSPSRLVRVPKSGVPKSAGTALPADSMGWSLVLAARVLARVRNGSSLTESLARLAGEDSGARSAAQDMAYGVLRSHGRGAFILGRMMSKPVTHPETQEVLLAALYRLETRPQAPHMIVDQAVAAAQELSGQVFTGLVNAVLRNFLRRQKEILGELEQEDAARYQHPEWWLKRLRRAYPEAWGSIVETNNHPPPMTLRINQRRATLSGYLEELGALGLEAAPVGKHGVILGRPVPVDQLPGFSLGRVSVQDAGAQRAAELLDPASGTRVLDACAAPGGKTAHLLEQAEIDLLALDIDAGRSRRIEENLTRLGLKAEVRVADCLDVSSWWDGRPFDAILADVPCSASGVVRRHPDIKSLRRESDIRRFALTQGQILDALWPLLKPGGRLLYATCSVFSEENGAQIDAFLVRQPGTACLAREQLLPGEKNDGFFYALLRKPA